MPPLPVVSGKDAIRVFERCGYAFSHQTGGHVILRRSTPPHRHLSDPFHKELAKGTLRGLIRDAGLTVEEFITLLGLRCKAGFPVLERSEPWPKPVT